MDEDVVELLALAMCPVAEERALWPEHRQAMKYTIVRTEAWVGIQRADGEVARFTREPYARSAMEHMENGELREDTFCWQSIEEEAKMALLRTLRSAIQ